MGECIEALGLSYEQDSTGLHFEDGVSYTLAEAMHIAKVGAKADDLRVIHQVKKLFGGEMILDKVQERTRKLTIPRVCSMDISEARLEKMKERARQRRRRENEDWWKRRGYR